MNSNICLNEKYSTTKLVTKDKPIFKHNPKFKLEKKIFWSDKEQDKNEGGLRLKGYFKKSVGSKPLMSVVTVVYNGEMYLEQTINSVLDQTYDNIEYIIIDGGSKDGTIDIIKKYEDKLDYWISETDNGIYDAMNKGISLASGKYIGFLNADDWYPNDSIESIVNIALKSNPGYIFGDMDLYDDDKFIGKRLPNLNRYKRSTPIGHQSLFVQVRYLREKAFDTRYKVIADYDFMIKLIKEDISYVHLDRSLVNFRIDGISSMVDYRNEKFNIHYNHFGIRTALYGYIIGTKNPLISKLIQILVKIKHYVKQSKIN